MITLAQAKKLILGKILYSNKYRNADETPERWKISGKFKKCRTISDRVKVYIFKETRKSAEFEKDQQADEKIYSKTVVKQLTRDLKTKLGIDVPSNYKFVVISTYRKELQSFMTK